MNKTDLISVIAEKLDVQRKEADKKSYFFLITIFACLAKGVKVSNKQASGYWRIKKRAGTYGRNPRTKEEFEIPETLVPQFKQGSSEECKISTIK
jgi:DNA-binding protein HU-beta